MTTYHIAPTVARQQSRLDAITARRKELEAEVDRLATRKLVTWLLGDRKGPQGLGIPEGLLSFTLESVH